MAEKFDLQPWLCQLSVTGWDGREVLICNLGSVSLVWLGEMWEKFDLQPWLCQLSVTGWDVREVLICNLGSVSLVWLGEMAEKFWSAMGEVAKKFSSATCISEWQFTQFSDQIPPWDTLCTLLWGWATKNQTFLKPQELFRSPSYFWFLFSVLSSSYLSANSFSSSDPFSNMFSRNCLPKLEIIEALAV